MYKRLNFPAGEPFTYIELYFNREPNEDHNYSYTMGSLRIDAEARNDFKRYFHGNKKEFSYELVADVIEFLDQYEVSPKK